jgi:hypothetical protein
MTFAPLLCLIQLMATCAMGRPISFENASRSDATFRLRSVSICCWDGELMRPDLSPGRLWRPVRTPPANGDQAITAMSRARAIGRNSRSMFLSTNEYCNCSPVTGGQAPLLSDGVRPADDPGRGVGEAEVVHLALPDEIVDRPHDLGDRCGLIPHMEPIDINVIGLQPL